MSIELVNLWNQLDGYNSDKEGKLPEHLQKLQDAIISVRKYLKENTPPKDNTIKYVEIKNPKYETREGIPYLISGDIVFINGMKIGEANKDNKCSIGCVGVYGIKG